MGHLSNTGPKTPTLAKVIRLFKYVINVHQHDQYQRHTTILAPEIIWNWTYPAFKSSLFTIKLFSWGWYNGSAMFWSELLLLHSPPPHSKVRVKWEKASAVNQKPCCASIFVDLKKAFDIIDDIILLSKTNKNSIKGDAPQWVYSYLNKKKQFVWVNNVRSILGDIQCGVPQCSVLRHKLFECKNSFKMVFFLVWCYNCWKSLCILENGKS